MSAIFVWRDRLQNTYAGYAKYIDKTVQFILALAAFMMINNYFGLFEPITKPIVAVALAVIFTFLPMVALEKASKLSAKTFLERAYILDRWIFCLQCRECFRRNVT